MGKGMMRALGIFALVALGAGCAGEVDAEEPPARERAPAGDSWDDGNDLRPSPSAPSSSGTIRFLTYNVAGLPDVISKLTPSKSIPLISPKLNAYDVVVVQEAFAYFPQLTSALTFAFKTEPSRAQLPKVYGDGLALFARSAAAQGGYEAWTKCNGTFDQKNDCLAAKGFHWVTLRPAPGVEIDLYDLHMDAGEGAGDIRARDEQTKQLADYIANRRSDNALIVAGDTNMDEGSEAGLLELLRALRLRDACRELACSSPSNIDRVMVRDSASVKLNLANWRFDHSFTGPDGKPLSDHDPVAVDISWQRL
jgi:endonuclease/exonuclease/phosphatase family metal-dependent hydrolase